ncbi:MAG: radical SAM protein [Planctomycetes bacterium]|jgi:radical SAM protein with 4Fe4S-binding SPASM domain|nr:radical SAM protein [Planctomycetota bacterium]
MKDGKTEKPALSSLGWGFSGCNMNCWHCYNNSTWQHPEHSFAILKNIADKVCPQIKSINYGTGEFICNPNTVALAQYIFHSFPRVKQAVTSNGFTIVMMEKTNLSYFHDVDISLDFPFPEKHNRFRGHPLAWKWFERSLEICQEAGLEKSIVTCVTSETSDDDIKEFLELTNRLGASWRTNWFRKTGRGKAWLQITAKRFWEVIRLLARQGVSFESLSDPLLASMLGYRRNNPTAGCACGTLSGRIQTDLTVTPCVYLKGKRWSGGLIVDKSLEEISSSGSFRSLKDRFPAVCRDCRYGSTCRGGCASRAYLHTGSLNNPDDYCPYHAGPDTAAVLDIIEEIKSLSPSILEGTAKVHDGYLCTMILKP